jgi:hypothetical protein
MWELMNKQACGESENAALYMIKDGDSRGEVLIGPTLLGLDVRGRSLRGRDRRVHQWPG